MKTVLLIEDDKLLRENTTEILQLSHYNVLAAENGKSGVKIAIQNRPDIIVCDIMMPKWDGYKVFNVLNRKETTKRIPFIFMSAKSEERDIRTGMNLGADDYISKPFKESDLLNSIDSRLKKLAFVRGIPKQQTTDPAENKMASLSEFKTYIKSLGDDIILSKNKLVYKEQKNANYVYLTEKGMVKNYRMDEYGKELITGLYKSGDLFGFYSFNNPARYSETATALEDGLAYRISNLHFREILSHNPLLTMELAELLSDNLTTLKSHLLEMAYASVLKKTSNTILKFAAKMQDNQHDSINISRSDLASVAGISTESLIRSLSLLKKDRLIDIDGRNIKILNLQKLYLVK
ncbi:response regulator [Gillisia limnaea]|uniref:Transcriptional regulator, Crp/Fnr family n=1 Tax=Gillisia limnaea (strain DSM 15749 / LMG 21470 / R-8282) TaxID=865937 RepID=H2BUG7_GILLR|nr:response regulator [Gillisia limnaea]EHQ03845.1 transcriptional regulator, Crp/Fnr family [Gillisia limnaea DSM 15749]